MNGPGKRVQRLNEKKRLPRKKMSKLEVDFKELDRILKQNYKREERA